LDVSLFSLFSIIVAYNEAYKRASKEEAKYCAEIFGGVAEDYIRAFA